MIVIIKALNHHLLKPFKTAYLQGITVKVEDRDGAITLYLSAASYCPPSDARFTIYLKTLGNHFIYGGDWNANHSY